MATLLVGDTDCSVTKVLDVIMSGAGSEELYSRWLDIATALETPGEKKNILRQNVLLGLVNVSAAMEAILIEWRARKASEATITELARVFLDKKLKAVAERLEERFVKEKNSLEDDADYSAGRQYIPSPPNTSFAPGEAEEDKREYLSRWNKVEEESYEERENFGMRMIGAYFDIKVKKPGKPMDFDDDHYKLPSGFKWYALVLNIIEFANSKYNRDGARHDSHGMTTLWTQLGYKVIMYDDGIFTASRLQRIIAEFIAKINEEQKRDPDSISSIVVFIGCHGEFNQIQFSDLSELNLYQDIVFQFDSDQCPALNGKPKIFIVSTCQNFVGEPKTMSPRVKGMSVDKMCAPVTSDMKPIDDTVVCLASLPGYLAYRHQWLGTIFGNALAKVFAEQAHCTDLLKMLKATEERMSGDNAKLLGTAKQMPMYSCMGIKTLYFNMPSQAEQDE